MPFYVLDFAPAEGATPKSCPLTETDATLWLNRKNWKSCNTDQDVKKHVAALCPAKKALLNDTDEPPSVLAPGDEALLIQRDQHRHQDTLRQWEQQPKRVSPWVYLLLSVEKKSA